MKPAKVIVALYVLAGVVFIGAVLLFTRSNKAFAPERAGLDVLGEAPIIALTSQEGAAWSSETLEGKVWVADFFFTACGGPCPVMTEAMARVQTAFPTDQRLQFVSISVDPETDTPERLKEYGEQYGANFERWHFLTGPLEAIQQIAVEGFKVGSVEDPVIHSTRFVLVDQQGQIRGYYIGIDEEDVLKMQEDIKLLLQETSA